MSITAYVGLPGSGKSYGVTENVILPAIKQNREVWTNIPTNSEKFIKDYNSTPVNFDIEDIKNNNNWFQEVLPKGVLIIIDECWRLWPSGLKTTNMLESHKSFLAEHRHMVGENNRSIEIVLVTQDLAQLATYPRQLVETTYRSVKLSAVGADSKYRIDIYQGCVTGPNPPEKTKLDSQYGTFKKTVFQYYQSHTMSESGNAGNESKIDSRNNILKGSWLKFGLLAIILLAILSTYGFTTVIDSYSSPDETFITEEKHINTIPKLINENPPQTLPKPKPFDLLKGREIFITWNNGIFPDIEFLFDAISGTSIFALTSFDLNELGYDLKVFNNCLVIITNELTSYVATCKREEKNSIVDFDWQVAEK